MKSWQCLDWNDKDLGWYEDDTAIKTCKSYKTTVGRNPEAIEMILLYTCTYMHRYTSHRITTEYEEDIKEGYESKETISVHWDQLTQHNGSLVYIMCLRTMNFRDSMHITALHVITIEELSSTSSNYLHEWVSEWICVDDEWWQGKVSQRKRKTNMCGADHHKAIRKYNTRQEREVHKGDYLFSKRRKDSVKNGHVREEDWLHHVIRSSVDLRICSEGWACGVSEKET
jgi:hypothetical protein